MFLLFVYFVDFVFVQIILKLKKKEKKRSTGTGSNDDECQKQRVQRLDVPWTFVASLPFMYLNWQTEFDLDLECSSFA